MENWNATPCIFMSVHSNSPHVTTTNWMFQTLCPCWLGTSNDIQVIIMAYMHALPNTWIRLPSTLLHLLSWKFLTKNTTLSKITWTSTILQYFGGEGSNNEINLILVIWVKNLYLKKRKIIHYKLAYTCNHASSNRIKCKAVRTSRCIDSE